MAKSPSSAYIVNVGGGGDDGIGGGVDVSVNDVSQ